MRIYKDDTYAKLVEQARSGRSRDWSVLAEYVRSLDDDAVLFYEHMASGKVEPYAAKFAKFCLRHD